MLTTTNYQLVKQELTDRADITQISSNWDKIDTQLKKLSDEKFDKTGGTITGGTTISKGGLSVTGGTTTDALTANGKVTAKGGAEITGTLTASGKITGNGGLAITGATSLASLTTTGATIVPTPSANNHAATKKYVDDAITGKVEFNNFRLRSTVISRGTAPSTAQSLSIDFYDKDGLTNATDRLARIGYTLGTDNAGALTMGVNNPKNGTAEDLAGIIAQWLADGTARISVTHHPVTGSNDKSIATTYWVRSLTATTSEFGLVKLADETALLSEADDATLTVDASYELNDFRRMNTAYSLGDKVNCAFNFGVFLECTQAGTTSAETLDTRSVTHGQVISDGTVQWTVRTHVKSINGNVPDADGNVTIDTVPPIATTEEAKAGTDDTKMMTPLKTKQVIDEFAPVKTVNGEEPDESGNIEVPMGLPLGHLFAWPFQTPPDGAIQCNGATYNRTLYADFYAYANSKGWVKTESEWQSIASANGGYCPWYSDGDGSTTFRTPKFAPFIQVAIASGSVGTYHQAGLPNITSKNTTATQIGGWSQTNGNISNGALSTTRLKNWGPRSQSSYRDGYHHMISLDASNCSSVYGSSDTVQPESHEWMICVVVMGQATNIRSADVSAVMGAVAQVQSDVSTKLDSSTVHVVDFWKSGKNWYRKWSDGFIEQGGFESKSGGGEVTVNFKHPFSSTECVTVTLGTKSVTFNTATINCVKTLSTSSMVISNGSYVDAGFYWRACGY